MSLRKKLGKFTRSSFPYIVKVKVKNGFWTWNAKSRQHARMIVKDVRAMGMKGKVKIIKR
jgi:hypothetical protein